MASLVAPASHKIVYLFSLIVGITGAKAGRSTSFKRLTTNVPAAINAPVAPAETTASISPVFASLHARTIDESLNLRIAIAGSLTSIGMTCSQ